MKKIYKDKRESIVPLGDRVLVRPFKETEELNMGKVKLVLPESVSKEKSDRGKVMAVGEGRREDGKIIPVRVKVGDVVLFSKYGYDEVEADGDELYLIKEDNILAIIK